MNLNYWWAEKGSDQPEKSKQPEQAEDCYYDDPADAFTRWTESKFHSVIELE